MLLPRLFGWEPFAKGDGNLAIPIGIQIIGGTPGSVLFVGAGGVLAQDNANLFWDDANNALGVGTNTIPAGVRLLVNGVISSPHTGTESERFGAGSGATGARSVAFGNLAHANFSDAIAIGHDADPSQEGICIGTDTHCGLASIAMGVGAEGSGARQFVAGFGADGGGGSDVFIFGQLGDANGNSNVVLFGRNVEATASGQVVFGDNTGSMPDLFLGNGVVSSTVGSGASVNATGGSGTNVAGAPLAINGGRSTGNAVGGDVTIRVSPAGGAGTTPNALVTVATFGAGAAAGTFGIFGASPVTRQSVTGSRGGNAALASLLAAMATFGWITDNTTA